MFSDNSEGSSKSILQLLFRSECIKIVSKQVAFVRATDFEYGSVSAAWKAKL